MQSVLAQVIESVEPVQLSILQEAGTQVWGF